MAAPSKIRDEALVNKLLKAISMGQVYKRACSYAGVSYVHFRKWQIRAAADREASKETDHTRFLDKLEHAEAVMEHRCLARIEAGKGGWQGAAWKLERGRFREDWSPPTRVELSGPGGGPVALAVTAVAELDAMLTARVEPGALQSCEPKKLTE